MNKISFILFFVVSFSSVIVSRSEAGGPLTQGQKDNLVTVMQGLQEGGLVKRMDLKLNTAYVEDRLWNALNVEQKQSVTVCLAMWCGWKNGDNIYMVTLKGWRSGKKLAKYNTTWGFKLY
jgi:hypothetical protein